MLCTLVAWFWGNLIKFEWQREFLRVILARSAEKPRGIGETEGDAGCVRGYPGLGGEQKEKKDSGLAQAEG